ncbi:low temperature requirement protein A [Micromonospora sp. HUAS LYJ1]|uniref:low temperature requirement protein A n=1 Tax=Micromonospora sp. HUAS LYJ1 TaxID=3061626 RepID=UPI002673FB76|nr:low temperature requirement protein A [Micromonospora sp. HUAS LYJ1]WKU05441.1 hypothetical protein Q2K16_32690 [Micromonospora sp. HUAS LYJ1]
MPFELFFDLVYVFATTQITAYLAHEHSRLRLPAMAALAGLVAVLILLILLIVVETRRHRRNPRSPMLSVDVAAIVGGPELRRIKQGIARIEMDIAPGN